MLTFNNREISEQFTMTCKKCGSKHIEICALEIEEHGSPLGVRAFVTCTECVNEVLDESWVD